MREEWVTLCVCSETRYKHSHDAPSASRVAGSAAASLLTALLCWGGSSHPSSKNVPFVSAHVADGTPASSCPAAQLTVPSAPTVVPLGSVTE